MSVKIQTVAHRGASGYAPETTLESYRMALEMGADWVETDVRMSRDGIPVAIHDADVDRTTNGRGCVADLTLEELKALDAGSWFNNAFPDRARAEYAGLRIPSLQEVIDLVRESSTGLLLEIKDPDRYRPGLEAVLLSLVLRNAIEHRTRVLSFSAPSLRRIKELAPFMPTVLLIAKPDGDPVKATIEASADELGILYTRATTNLVEATHGSGLAISVWTVDHPEDMRRMIGLGVDRITTNYPDRLIKLIAAC